LPIGYSLNGMGERLRALVEGFCWAQRKRLGLERNQAFVRNPDQSITNYHQCYGSGKRCGPGGGEGRGGIRWRCGAGWRWVYGWIWHLGLRYKAQKGEEEFWVERTLPSRSGTKPNDGGFWDRHYGLSCDRKSENKSGGMRKHRSPSNKHLLGRIAERKWSGVRVPRGKSSRGTRRRTSTNRKRSGMMCLPVYQRLETTEPIHLIEQ